MLSLRLQGVGSGEGDGVEGVDGVDKPLCRHAACADKGGRVGTILRTYTGFYWRVRSMAHGMNKLNCTTHSSRKQPEFAKVYSSAVSVPVAGGGEGRHALRAACTTTRSSVARRAPSASQFTVGS